MQKLSGLGRIIMKFNSKLAKASGDGLFRRFGRKSSVKLRKRQFLSKKMLVIYKKSAFINISGIFLGLFLAWVAEKFIFVYN